MNKLRKLWQLINNPVRLETSKRLNDIWSDLDPALRTDQQMLGRHEEGCGATIGVMPQCDFACQCCYLGKEANQIPALPLEKIKEQMLALRQRLGVWGNLQLTDGEVTLRKSKDVIEILRYAREIELIPMLMTHGDSFRRKPGLLEQLINEGGLSEISLHIDITQRGRLGKKYKYAKREIDLMPLREEFATMVRRVRKKTNKSLRVASTVTVVPANLPEIAEIVSWFKDNSDVFRLLSFQPVASVGRTDQKIDGVDRDSVWKTIAEGLNHNHDIPSLLAHQWWLGHSDCSRFVMGLTVRKGRSNTSFYPLSIAGGDKTDSRILKYFYKNWGGVTFRADDRLEKIARTLGMFAQSPLFFLYELPRYLWRWFQRIDSKNPGIVPFDVIKRRLQLHRFTVVTHHFMSKRELDTVLGQERIRHCAFVVPINGHFKSMCEVNATDIRNRFYAEIQNSNYKKKEEVLLEEAK